MFLVAGNVGIFLGMWNKLFRITRSIEAKKKKKELNDLNKLNINLKIVMFQNTLFQFLFCRCVISFGSRQKINSFNEESKKHNNNQIYIENTNDDLLK